MEVIALIKIVFHLGELLLQLHYNVTHYNGIRNKLRLCFSVNEGLKCLKRATIQGI